MDAKKENKKWWAWPTLPNWKDKSLGGHGSPNRVKIRLAIAADCVYSSVRILVLHF